MVKKGRMLRARETGYCQAQGMSEFSTSRTRLGKTQNTLLNGRVFLAVKRYFQGPEKGGRLGERQISWRLETVEET